MVGVNLPREFKFLRDVVVLPAYMSREGVILKYMALELFGMYEQWVLESKLAGFSLDLYRFGEKLSSMVSGSGLIEGVSKSRKNTGIEYRFDVDVLIASMIEKMWFNADEVPVPSRFL
jgi:hypothetical protein